MHRILRLWYVVRASLWFIPGLMLTVSVVFAVVFVEVDGRINRELLLKYPRVFGLGADGSRGMLTAIAGSMLTVAALVFSLTLSIIAQASGQYSPRILRNFMRDRVNQFVLGYFVSVFAFCLVVLRTIRGADEIKFVPSLAVMIGLVFAFGGILVLIYFIHHIATSLQVTNIIDQIVEDTSSAIDGIFPRGVGEPAGEKEKFEEAEKLLKGRDWYEIPSRANGYIQFVNVEGLLDYAVDKNIVIRMEQGVGEFVGKGEAIASVAADVKTAGVIVDDEVIEAISSKYQIYRHRSIEQDAGYGIRQIVDIALKALSPGVNDTTTAVICIDYLGVIVSDIAARTFPENIRLKDGRVRVLVKAPSFETYVQTAFDQIRINGKGNVAVFRRLLLALALIAKNNKHESRKPVLKEQMELIKDYALETLETDYEKEKVLNEVARVRKILND